MSLSTSNSNQLKFLAWMIVGFVASGIVINAIPWSSVTDSRSEHHACASAFGDNLDFLIVGDSKVGPFSKNCVIPWLPGYRGLAFSALSATPVFHYENLRAILELYPDFAPKVVFISIGANNVNSNGLHVQKDFIFFNTLDLGTVWDLSADQGEFLPFVEAVLARLFPVYGKRGPITHLAINFPEDSEASEKYTESEFDDPVHFEFKPAARNEIVDRNYLDIYRRSVYANYETSVVHHLALERLIELVESFGGTPVILFLPVAEEINELGDQLVGDAFYDDIFELSAKHNVPILNLRERTDFELNDVNHLSARGAYTVTRQEFLPVVKEIVFAHRPVGQNEAMKLD